MRRELAALNKVLQGLKPPAGFAALKHGLAAVNESLWEIEDKIRAKEAASAFDQEFIDLARSVYFNNDKRAAPQARDQLALEVGPDRGKAVHGLQGVISLVPAKAGTRAANRRLTVSSLDSRLRGKERSLLQAKRIEL